MPFEKILFYTCMFILFNPSFLLCDLIEFTSPLKTWNNMASIMSRNLKWLYHCKFINTYEAYKEEKSEKCPNWSLLAMVLFKHNIILNSWNILRGFHKSMPGLARQEKTAFYSYNLIGVRSRHRFVRETRFGHKACWCWCCCCCFSSLFPIWMNRTEWYQYRNKELRQNENNWNIRVMKMIHWT